MFGGVRCPKLGWRHRDMVGVYSLDDLKCLDLDLVGLEPQSALVDIRSWNVVGRWHQAVNSLVAWPVAW